jgi:inosose dehydratase
VALLDITKLYADRIKLLHLRQSHNGVWSETCETGDIDYEQLATILGTRGVRPLLVLEQALEAGTPSTLEPVTAYQRSRNFIAQVFGQS